MARISTVEGRSGYVVAIRGDITSADLRRLEHACGPAIEQQRPLEIVFARTTVMDAAARAYLERLASRGALVIRR